MLVAGATPTWYPKRPPQRRGTGCAVPVATTCWLVYALPDPAAGGDLVTVRVSITVNGRRFDKDVEPRQLLVHFIRDLGGFTGTKVGCDTSQCGSCTVLLDGIAVKSCTCLAAQADGAEVTTIEGLAADGQLHPIQEAFWNTHGLQCGFCTPGMIMATHELLRTNATPTDEAIRHGLAGNFCRCTGYQNIVKAVREAATVMAK